MSMISIATVTYVFLAGAGAGASLLGTLTSLLAACSGSPRFRSLSAWHAPGFVVGPLFVALASLFLVFDLGRPAIAWKVLLHPFTSILSLGAWFIVLFLVASVALLGLMATRKNRMTAAAAVLCAVAAALSLCVILYTAALFHSLIAIDFWHTPTIFALFLASSLSTGAAANSAASIMGVGGAQTAGSRHSLMAFVLGLLEAAAVVAFVIGSHGLDPVAASRLLTGTLATVFWGGIVIVGLAVPLTVNIKCHRHAKTCRAGMDYVLLIADVATLVGGFFVRYCVLFAPLVA